MVIRYLAETGWQQFLEGVRLNDPTLMRCGCIRMAHALPITYEPGDRAGP